MKLDHLRISVIVALSLSTILITGAFPLQSVFAQGVQTSGGVDIDGSWYLGEGLKHGDYFEYSFCELDLNDCAPLVIKMWFKGDTKKETETVWDVDVVILDGNKIVKGNMGLGKIAPDPVDYSENIFDYSRAFKSSISWLSAFATASENDRIFGPKDFKDPAWGKIGAIGGAQLIPKRTETVFLAGYTLDTVVVGWYSGQSNEIWIVDDFPFPVKALAYAWVTTGIAPVMYQFQLLKFEENVQSDPFVDVVPTIEESKLLGCPDKYFNYISGTKATNTFSMTIQYNYSPENPMAGCYIDWKINFKNKFNIVQFVDQIHYDIWVVDDNGAKLRSYAEDLGKVDFFNGFGQVHVLLPVEENPGLVHYAIFVYGVAPENVQPLGEFAGYVIVDIDIVENKNIPKSENGNNVVSDVAIPGWIKTNAGWWKDGLIDDNSFVQGIQFLIKEGIMKIPQTSQGSSYGSDEIPDWIKTNAGWWQEGLITDNDFVQGIQFLIENGIMRIS